MRRTRRIAVGSVTVVAAIVLAACGKKESAPPAESAAAPAAGAAAGAPATAAASGEQVFQRCVTCHQAQGQGIPGTYPPLAGSEFANAKNVEVPIRIVLHGLQGPITVKGTEYNGAMPAYGTGVEMSDAEVAAVLTYVRSSFGNQSSPVTAQDVAKVRAAGGTGPMSADSLKKLM